MALRIRTHCRVSDIRLPTGRRRSPGRRENFFIAAGILVKIAPLAHRSDAVQFGGKMASGNVAIIARRVPAPTVSSLCFVQFRCRVACGDR